MLHASTTKSTRKRVRFYGICAAAKALEVERTHLYRVLTGERPSKSLLSRYRALKGAAK